MAPPPNQLQALGASARSFPTHVNRVPAETWKGLQSRFFSHNLDAILSLTICTEGRALGERVCPRPGCGLCTPRMSLLNARSGFKTSYTLSVPLDDIELNTELSKEI